MRALKVTLHRSIHAYIHTSRHTDRNTDIQTDRQTDGQTDRQTDGNTDRHIHIHIHPFAPRHVVGLYLCTCNIPSPGVDVCILTSTNRSRPFQTARRPHVGRKAFLLPPPPPPPPLVHDPNQTDGLHHLFILVPVPPLGQVKRRRASGSQGRQETGGELLLYYTVLHRTIPYYTAHKVHTSIY
jgi:hypothetical protein